MLSKIQIASGVLATAHGLTQIKDASTGALLPLNKSLGCAECLLSGHIYCKQRGWWEWIKSSTPHDTKLPTAYGICCDETTYQCEDAAGAKFAPTEDYFCSKYNPTDTLRASRGYSDLSLAVSACQHQNEKCGTRVINLDDATTYPGNTTTLGVVQSGGTGVANQYLGVQNLTNGD
jgi:hypothetical protein